MDQFASNVVEKCLKIGGVEFLSRYLDRVCEGCIDHPHLLLSTLLVTSTATILFSTYWHTPTPTEGDRRLSHPEVHGPSTQI